MRRGWTSSPPSRGPTTNSSQARPWSGPRTRRSRYRAKPCACRKSTTARVTQPFWRSTGRETGSNAPGFVGHDWSYQAGATLTWSLDLTTFANIRRQDARADAERARELRTSLFWGDAIHQQWNTVVAGIARSRAARAGRQAAFEAAAQAQIRYAVGNVTQLDLLQAQRDAFIADVNRIQADAELANARAQLRLASGRSLVESTQERNNSLP